MGRWLKMLTATTAALGLSFAIGCDQSAAEDLEDAAEDAAEQAEDAGEDAAERLEGAADELTN